MKTPLIKKLYKPAIMNAVSHLKQQGRLYKSKNNLVYIDIDDNFIHKLFPMLNDDQVSIPAYFGQDSVGAHITVFYPEEGNAIDEHDLQNEHHFTIKDLVMAEIGQKIYYVLLVDSPSLSQLRRKYHLPDLLCFKGYSIQFHITIGVRVNPKF